MRVYTQTNGDVSCGVIAACSGATMLASAIDTEMSEGGTPGTGEQTVSLPTGGVLRGAMVMQSDPVGLETWDAGDWVVRLNVTTAQNDTALRAVHVCRINSSCGTVESVASETGLNVSIAGGGVFTRTLAGSESTRVGGEDDAFYIVVVLSNAHSHTTRNVGITPDQDVDTPLAAGAQTHERTLSDTFTVSEGLATTLDLERRLTASQSLADALTSTIEEPSVGETFERALSDALSVNDSLLRGEVFSRALGDTFTFRDDLGRLQILVTLMHDMGGVMENLVATSTHEEPGPPPQAKKMIVRQTLARGIRRSM